MEIDKISSIEELEAMQAQIKERLSKLRKQQIASARKKIQALAEEIGVDIADLVPTVRHVAAKYCNTEAPHQTWAGRGKKPAWLVKAIEKGASLEDFKI